MKYALKGNTNENPNLVLLSALKDKMYASFINTSWDSIEYDLK